MPHDSADRAGREAARDWACLQRLPLASRWTNYLATAANAFGHAVKSRVLAIDWIVRITHQVLLRGHLIGPRLAMPDRRLRYRLLVRAHQRNWGWISRIN